MSGKGRNMRFRDLPQYALYAQNAASKHSQNKKPLIGLYRTSLMLILCFILIKYSPKSVLREPDAPIVHCTVSYSSKKGQCWIDKNDRNFDFNQSVKVSPVSIYFVKTD